MDLEIGSDDDIFLEAKDVSSKGQQVWSPKQCEPAESVLAVKPVESEDCSPTTTTEHAQILCYRGDFLYSKKRFASALAAYRTGLTMVPIRYVILRRMFLEGAARCYVYLRECDQALSMAVRLLEESLTLDHRMTAHSLLATVHTAAGNQHEAIKSLQICIQWQRSNVHFWLRLAEAYCALYRQSKLALRANQSDDKSGPTGCYRCSNSTSYEAECKSYTGGIAFRNKGSGRNNSVGPPAQVVNAGRRKPAPSGFGPQEEPPRDDGADAVPEAGRNQPEACRDSNAHSCSAQGTGELNRSETTPCQAKSGSFERRGASPEMSEHNGGGNEAEGSDVSVADLLNKLDGLAVTDGDASEPCEEQARAELACTGCRPAHCAASCLLRARLLLKSVAHSVRSFAKVKNGQQLHQIDQALADLHLSPGVMAVLHHQARQIFRRGHYHRVDGVAPETEEAGEGGGVDNDAGGGESKRSVEEFEQGWFPWVSS